MNNNENLMNELLAEAMAQRLEKAQIMLLDEVKRRIETQLDSGMNKKEFIMWFNNSIIELKQQVSNIPVYKRW